MKRVIALGFFDGVHLGHAALLRKARQEADRLGCQAAALTFDQHPSERIFGKKMPLINTLAERERMMKECFGMDEVIVLPFDEAMMRMPWQGFAHMLRQELHAEAVVCGHDFTFGYKGEGSGEQLRDIFGERCHVIEPVQMDGQVVSSSLIRELLQTRQIEQANRLLGHCHFITGKVIHGKHLGRKIGIPTTNILPKDILVPSYGVYASRVNGRPAVTNIGCRPTLEDGDAVTVESWILDFSGDLYGKTICVELERFIRPERKFSSVDDLKTQILQDAEHIRACLD